MITLNNINLSSIDLSGIDLRGIKLGLGGRGGGSGDGFPVLPGDVTRWYFGGLTNEMMAAMDDPRIEDADHKGRFLSFKNFAWKGMSGVNGYVQNFNNFKNNATVDKVRIDEQSSNSIKVTILTTGISNAIYIPKNIYQFNKSYSIKISSEGYNEGDLSLSFYASSVSTATTVKVPLNPNGITEIPAIKEDDFLAVYLNVGGKVGLITIEQLPLYPGFILGDGVDDFAVTEKELNFEDTYTVYTAFIPFQDDPIRGMVVCGKDFKKDFYLYYSGTHLTYYTSGLNDFIPVHINQFHIIVCKCDKTNAVIKNLITGESKTFSVSELINNPGVYYLWRYYQAASYYAKAAIAGQIIANGHFTTDEEDENILNWHKKQYPWLFPNQAWTVVGKTNEDEDRATIANITGNGNDLVLSNFGFAEGSGYGLYAENYAGGRWVQSTDRADLTWTSYSVNITSVKVASTQLYYQSYPEQPSFIVPSYKIKVYGLKDGQTLSYRQATSEGQQLYKISEDGTYTLPSFPFKANGDWYGFTLNKVQESCDITIEQIPEYEGYLVTDGVDDVIQSKRFLLHRNWTMVGDWRFMPPEKNTNSGIVKSPAIRLYNQLNNIAIYINRTTNPKSISGRSIKTVCSDGRIYLDDWSEFLDTELQTDFDNNTVISIANYGVNFTKMIFKNLSFYDNQLLSKDDCIKAYNYLQTLKAKKHEIG